MASKNRNPSLAISRPQSKRKADNPQRNGEVRWSLFAGHIAGAIICAICLSCSTPPPTVVRPNNNELDSHVYAYFEPYIRWAEEEPLNPQRHATLGVVYEANELWNEARSCFHTVVDLLPSEVLARYHEAMACQEMGETVLSRELLQAITDDQPDFAPAQHRLGLLLLAEDKLEAASSAFQKTVELAPDRVEGYLGLATVRLRSRDHEKAERFSRQALQIDIQNRMAWYLLGQSLRVKPGAEAEALKALRAGTGALITYLDDPWSSAWPIHAKGLADQMRLAHNLATAGKSTDAVKVLEAALAQRPGNTDVLNNLAVILRRSGQPSRALAYLQQAQAVSPVGFATLINIAACNLDLGRFDAALEVADRAIFLFESNAQAHVTKARILFAQGKLEMADSIAKRAVELSNEDPLPYLTLADIQFQRRQFESSVDTCRTASELSPLQIEPLLCSCRALVALDRQSEARIALEEARILRPTDPRLDQFEQRLVSKKHD